MFIILLYTCSFYLSISANFIPNGIIFVQYVIIQKYMLLVFSSIPFTYVLVLGRIVCNGLMRYMRRTLNGLCTCGIWTLYMEFVYRGVSRTAATSKVELFAIIVNCFLSQRAPPWMLLLF